MARTLSNPITRDPVTKQILTGYFIVIGVTDGTPDASKTFFEYRVTDFAPDGREISAQTRRIYLADLPSAVKQDLRAIRNKAMTDAENQGLLKPGTDTEDL